MWVVMSWKNRADSRHTTACEAVDSVYEIVSLLGMHMQICARMNDVPEANPERPGETTLKVLGLRPICPKEGAAH